MTTTIVWEAEDTGSGREKSPFCEKTVFRPRKAIKVFCLSRAKQLATLPIGMRAGAQLRGMMQALQLSRPPLRLCSSNEIDPLLTPNCWRNWQRRLVVLTWTMLLSLLLSEMCGIGRTGVPYASRITSWVRRVDVDIQRQQYFVLVVTLCACVHVL
jgi:hypothetical protein